MFPLSDMEITLFPFNYYPISERLDMFSDWHVSETIIIIIYITISDKETLKTQAADTYNK